MGAKDQRKTKAQLIKELEQLRRRFSRLERLFAKAKAVQDSLQETERQYRNLTHNIPVGLFRNTPGPTGRFLVANPAIARMFGYERVKDFLKCSVAELYQDPVKRKEFVAEVCSGCNGEGRVREKKKLKVKIPPGMDSGTHLVMPGEGNGGMHGGPPGDLYIVMNVRPHDFFQREGYDLHLQVPISFVQAALGTRFTIPTLKASHELVIPPGTQPGEVIRLKGEGVPYPKGQRRGDLLVEVRVVIPRDLNARQQHLLNELAKEEPEPHTQPAGSTEHDEGLLKKLWNTITDSIGDHKQEHRKD